MSRSGARRRAGTRSSCTKSAMGAPGHAIVFFGKTVSNICHRAFARRRPRDGALLYCWPTCITVWSSSTPARIRMILPKRHRQESALCAPRNPTPALTPAHAVVWLTRSQSFVVSLTCGLCCSSWSASTS